MASPKSFTFHFKPQLLAVLVAALTGLALSSTIAVSVTDHALFFHLRQLWSSFLSWFTPRCLFVVLNGIIFALSASSGVLSSPTSGSNASDFCPKPLSRMPSRDVNRISEYSPEILSADDSPPNLSARMQGRIVQNLMMKLPSLSTDGQPVASDIVGDDQVEDLQFYDAEDKIETHGEVDDTHSVSKVQIKSVSFDSALLKIGDNEGSHCAVERSKHGLTGKKMAYFCREEGDFIQMTRKSVPCRLEFVTALRPRSITRSLSVDSAPRKDDEGLPDFASAETLSNEAFRQKVEDFIAKMNAQLRNEVK